MNPDLIRKITNLARKERLTYMDLAHIFRTPQGAFCLEKDNTKSRGGRNK